jgi:hypothetical protein
MLMSSGASANSKMLKKGTLAKNLSSGNGQRRLSRTLLLIGLAVIFVLTATTQVVLCGKINKTLIPSSLSGSFDNALQYLSNS